MPRYYAAPGSDCCLSTGYNFLSSQEELTVSERERSLSGDTGEGGEGSHFQTTFGLVLSCLGCVVGTGNIWRFPRIVANNSDEEGLCYRYIYNGTVEPLK